MVVVEGQGAVVLSSRAWYNLSRFLKKCIPRFAEAICNLTVIRILHRGLSKRSSRDSTRHLKSNSAVPPCFRVKSSSKVRSASPSLPLHPVNRRLPTRVDARSLNTDVNPSLPSIRRDPPTAFLTYDLLG